MRVRKSSFNDLEAVKIAINIEKRGERFYTKALQYSSDDDVSKMLKELAEQEREHADTFRDIYNKLLVEKDGFDDIYIYDPEVSAYFRSMADSTIFPSDEAQDEILKNIKSIADVLVLGIQAEKESILYYTEMVIQTRLIEGKEAFRRLIKEEKKHLVDLQERLNAYNAKQNSVHKT